MCIKVKLNQFHSISEKFTFCRHKVSAGNGIPFKMLAINKLVDRETAGNRAESLRYYVTFKDKCVCVCVRVCEHAIWLRLYLWYMSRAPQPVHDKQPQTDMIYNTDTYLLKDCHVET